MFEVTESLVYQIRRGQIWTRIVTPQTVAMMMAIQQDTTTANKPVSEDERRRACSVTASSAPWRPDSEIGTGAHSRADSLDEPLQGHRHRRSLATPTQADRALCLFLGAEDEHQWRLLLLGHPHAIA